VEDRCSSNNFLDFVSSGRALPSQAVSFTKDSYSIHKYGKSYVVADNMLNGDDYRVAVDCHLESHTTIANHSM